MPSRLGLLQVRLVDAAVETLSVVSASILIGRLWRLCSATVVTSDGVQASLTAECPLASSSLWHSVASALGPVVAMPGNHFLLLHFLSVLLLLLLLLPFCCRHCDACPMASVSNSTLVRASSCKRSTSNALLHVRFRICHTSTTFLLDNTCCSPRVTFCNVQLVLRLAPSTRDVLPTQRWPSGAFLLEQSAASVDAAWRLPFVPAVHGASWVTMSSPLCLSSCRYSKIYLSPWGGDDFLRGAYARLEPYGMVKTLPLKQGKQKNKPNT